MKQGFKACVCAVVLCAELFAAGALSAYAAQEQPLPDSGMTLDTAELTLDITEGDPAPVAYLNVQAPNDYFFLIWTSSDPAVPSAWPVTLPVPSTDATAGSLEVQIRKK